MPGPLLGVVGEGFSCINERDKMRKVKRWKYYCDFCKKSGGHAGYMRKHEERCTLNPNRYCGYCNELLEQEQPDLKEIMAALPDINEQVINTDECFVGWDDFIECAEDAMPKVRELAGNCPACIMAALRQRKIPVPCVESFSFKDECAAIWADVNESNAQRSYY